MILIDDKQRTKGELFGKMADYLKKHDVIACKKQFLNSINSRERFSNTEIIPNVAIPHADCETVQELFLLIYINKSGVKYEHPKFGDVNIVFLFGCGNKNSREYLKLLASSARMLKDESFRNELISCRDEQEIIALILTRTNESIIDVEANQYLLVTTLFQGEQLPDLLSSLLESGVNNASVIEYSSLAQKISNEMPLFSGLSFHSPLKNKLGSVVLSTIEDKTIPHRLVALLNKQGIRINNQGNCFIQIFRLHSVIGTIDEFTN